jgi:UDP-glucose 4-epimerase
MRILVTGLGTMWGSRVAQRLERQPGVDLVVGVDTREPRLALEKTEFVRADSSYAILQRILAATRVDTIVHTHLVTDSSEVRSRALHEINVIGTTNLVAAAGAVGSTVRKLVVKGSTLEYGSNGDDPYWWREDMVRRRPPKTRIERSLVEAADVVRDFADDNPQVLVTHLRVADVLGEEIDSLFSHLLRLPAVPEIFGFDPRLQFVHEDDATGALVFATLHNAPGTFNVAGDGVVPWSEVARMLGKRRVPLPPFFTGWAAQPARVLRLADLTPELLSLLRFGRAVDTTRFQHSGFRYRHTTAGAVDAFARGLRVREIARAPEYRYERDLETFFRHSPAVVRDDTPVRSD